MSACVSKSYTRRLEVSSTTANFFRLHDKSRQRTAVACLINVTGKELSTKIFITWPFLRPTRRPSR